MPCQRCGCVNRPEALVCDVCSAPVAEQSPRTRVLASVETYVQGVQGMPPHSGQLQAGDLMVEGPFVGRQQEMAALKGALEETRSGRGRLLMLVGEPGIGKTRTAEELAAHAEGQGSLVLWGHCYETPGAPPYWPWVQIIRGYLQQIDTDTLRAQMRGGAADIAEMVQEVQR